MQCDYIKEVTIVFFTPIPSSVVTIHAIPLRLVREEDFEISLITEIVHVLGLGN
jgi:hypothetical protein